MSYITNEELNKTLEAFETKNDSNEKSRQTEDNIKKIVSDRLDSFKLETEKNLDRQNSSVLEKVQVMLRQFEGAFKGSVVSEMNTLIVIMKKSIVEQVLAETHDVIKNFSMQNSSHISSSLQSYNSRIKDSVEVSMNDLKVEVDSKLNIFNESVKRRVDEEIKLAIHSQADNFSKTLTDKVTEQYHLIVDLVQNFKIDLTHDLDKKIVDKQSVEAKFQKIEDELKNQIDKTIKYQVEQTRSMMEQYAKAEISHLAEQIKNKTNSIFDNLE